MRGVRPTVVMQFNCYELIINIRLDYYHIKQLIIKYNDYIQTLALFIV